MKRLLVLAILLVWAGAAQAASLNFFVGKKLDYYQAEFIWTYENSADAVDNWVVECGEQPDVLTHQSKLLDRSINFLSIKDVIPFDNKNHVWYCSVGAVEGNMVVVDSNQVTLQVRGRSVWVLSNGQ